ncbi:hypothetical protein CRE_00440 [Caenorhabditis remanei]|uniref:Uncharacterized protein n=1 Tax=Caenorhabditis remanei TaxID=31234 RepID=E3LCQ1_CAERE|nr:hypothetical protein CRE_00440 [Caenorhabditis remanei]
MSEKIADGFGSLGELCEYHYSFVQDGKLTLVGKKFVNQPTHNWGHRVAFAGTYVLTLDKETNQWERHDFPELVGDENAEESLFVRDDKLYLLTFVNFGSIEFKKLFKWENNSFNEITLKAPEPKSITAEQKTDIITASGTTSNGASIIVARDDNCDILLYSLIVDGGSAIIDSTSHISIDSNPLRGMPVLAEVVGDKVLISYGVHGCGFRWENNRFFVFDLKSNSVRHVDIEGDYDKLPQFCFSGPRCSFVNKDTNSWIVAAGSVQQGMTGSAFYGSVWALRGDVFDENSKATWVQLPQTIEEGDHILDGFNLYTVSKEAVSKIKLDEI